MAGTENADPNDPSSQTAKSASCASKHTCEHTVHGNAFMLTRTKSLSVAWQPILIPQSCGPLPCTQA
eukprot:3867773-Alexandrium_andersonii.AAC.1